jgi:hypothetical protein
MIRGFKNVFTIQFMPLASPGGAFKHRSPQYSRVARTHACTGLAHSGPDTCKLGRLVRVKKRRPSSSVDVAGTLKKKKLM